MPCEGYWDSFAGGLRSGFCELPLPRCGRVEASSDDAIYYILSATDSKLRRLPATSTQPNNAFYRLWFSINTRGITATASTECGEFYSPISPTRSKTPAPGRNLAAIIDTRQNDVGGYCNCRRFICCGVVDCLLVLLSFSTNRRSAISGWLSICLHYYKPQRKTQRWI